MQANDDGDRPGGAPPPPKPNPYPGPGRTLATTDTETTSFTALAAREQIRVVEIFQTPFREALAEVLAARDARPVPR